MKKIFFTFFICILYISINAQQYSGYYQNSNTNNTDTIVKTAITNFFSTKMLKIDTYKYTSSGYNYFVLTFLDDYLTTSSSVKYDLPSQSRFGMINDVKYDSTNNCYLACGWCMIDNEKSAILICFDISGSINWQLNAWDKALQKGATEYNRVKICKPTASGGMTYAACGYRNNRGYDQGVTGLYDINGVIETMYSSNIQSVLQTRYTDLDYDFNYKILTVVGNFLDDNTNAGYVYQSYNLCGPPYLTSPAAIRAGNGAEVYGIKYNPNDGYFYIVGTTNSNSRLFISKLSSTTLTEYYYTSNDISSFYVTDNCYNYNYNRLGITGSCIYNGTRKEGFSLDFDLGSGNNGPTYLDFKLWSGYNAPNQLPFNDTYFQHIVYRENNAINPNYSYIMYGLPNINSKYSYIAEYYPDNTYSDCSDISLSLSIPHNLLFSDEIDTIILDTISSTIHLIDDGYSQNLIEECSSVVYSFNKAANKQNKSKQTIEASIRIENNIITFTDEYINAFCNIYNVNGQLIGKKEKGVNYFNTANLPIGIYLLRPINTNLKSIKFKINH